MSTSEINIHTEICFHDIAMEWVKHSAQTEIHHSTNPEKWAESALQQYARVYKFLSKNGSAIIRSELLTEHED